MTRTASVSLSRRSLFRAATGASLLAAVGGSRVRRLAAQEILHPPGLGSARADWEDYAGAGTPTGTLVSYANPVRAGMTILVGFDATDRVAHIEYGFEEAPAGGLSEAEGLDEVSVALPPDARLEEQYWLGQVDLSRTQYRIERHVSPGLSVVPGEPASMLLMVQERANAGTGEVVVPRITLTLSSALPIDDRVIGEPGGIGLRRNLWDEMYGAGEAAQAGVAYVHPDLPGYWLMVGFDVSDTSGDRGATSIDSVPQGDLVGIDVGDARSFAASMIPAGSTLQALYEMPPTPEGPIGLRAEWWTCPALATHETDPGSVLVVYHEMEGSSATVVARVSLLRPSEFLPMG